MSKITTVEDRDGRVWTGAEVDTSNTGRDVAAAILSCGMTAIAQALTPDDGNRTVEVNGHQHYGREVR